MTDSTVEAIRKYVRATNYLSVAQIYLQDNFLLSRKLRPKDIKPRLLGHWGTCPGINFIYAHLNRLIIQHDIEALFVLGPGHGFPALQANLFAEGTLGAYYPKATQDENGVAYVAKEFSWPYGFPSHSSPSAPGVIVEGGELGYALSTAYGAALDNPDLLVACVIGDGEAETAATATAWHLHRFIHPAKNGAVLPILHLNGYKISGPTIFGRMSDDELTALFLGYGYEPHIVQGDTVYEAMSEALDASYKSIRRIKEVAQSQASTGFRPPMIILRTPKGWTGIKELHGKKIEGNHLSHQVVGVHAKTDPEEFSMLEAWLASYRFEELFDAKRGFTKDIMSLIPKRELRMGDNWRVFGGAKAVKPLLLPPAEQFSEDADVPGTIGSSSMRRSGLYLNEVFRLNKEQNNFRLFSPDETYSNKLDGVFETTARASAMPVEAWDKDLSPDGRVMEMLSEHSLQGMFQGYLLTGRHGIFASYEAFIQVVGSMADQYLKFLKGASEVEWRGFVPSLNYILTSSGWRQEHNGFSHQNPGFISDLLQKPGCFVKVYFPPDGNSTLAVLRHVLTSRNLINIIVAGKTQESRWLSPELAEQELKRGLMVWDFASEENPDIVFAGVGDYLTKEALAALSIVKREAPSVRVRFVNILELSTLGVGDSVCLSPVDFDTYFTADKPVLFNFHGYPSTLRHMLFAYSCNDRFSVHGYIENGSTTTPFDMQVRNETSRFHLAIEAFAVLSKRGVLDQALAKKLINTYQGKLSAHTEYIRANGVDTEEIEQWQFTPLS